MLQARRTETTSKQLSSGCFESGHGPIC
ncbi:hypothetical protein QTG54_008304 [Skeletonema marinoi]|uniref:Uncharacterized protein n=1 Tax=Skeletonema marinoi TaxID=267567 RepID=A0AAD8Y8S0_9STRA|nr:hypothetical protein QTG54_008304 [Skeletonema marinoi]